MKKRRIKLNMLEPGTRMLAVSGILILFALPLYLLGCKLAAYILGGVAAALFVVLLILVRIELWQDEQDYLRYKDETKK